MKYESTSISSEHDSNPSLLDCLYGIFFKAQKTGIAVPNLEDISPELHDFMDRIKIFTECDANICATAEFYIPKSERG